MFFLRGLPRDLRVLVVEKGHHQDHKEQLASGTQVLENIPVINTSQRRKFWTAHTVFGGNSNCWWACTPRMHPNDFRLKSKYGVGWDWPLSYETLEPFYLEAERVMDVAGGGSDHILPRSAPFPYPPHAYSRSDVALQRHSHNWFAQPTARSNGGKRAQCCSNGICNLCPVDSKFSVLNGRVDFERDGVALLVAAEVREVVIEAGLATGVMVRNQNGVETQIRASLVALGANAIFNAAIMLRSGVTSWALGRYLHEQVSQYLLYDLGPGQLNYFGGTSIPGHGYDLYDGEHRSERGAVLIENHNTPASVRAVPGRWTERLKLKIIAEDMPQETNRVVLAENEVAVQWGGHSDYAELALDRAISALPGLLPFDIESQTVMPRAVSEEHIQGTHRMGTDAKTSVVDAELKCHQVPNLLALGAGAYPSCSPANPTLTLSALSLYAAGRV
ncbi:MAG: GMC family oxidoreductase [Rhodobacteraceae bacterium]|nr:GMC family oxidoreductase [Paracoccaceae bacterium]